MNITDGAKQILVGFLSKREAEGIRLTSVEGCCGPQFRISLDAPIESDRIETINGIRVAIDSEVTGSEELTIDKGENGAGIVLIGGSNCC
jgi:iron-sulfur cluster assembly protein